jgi:hypothetical protein
MGRLIDPWLADVPVDRAICVCTSVRRNGSPSTSLVLGIGREQNSLGSTTSTSGRGPVPSPLAICKTRRANDAAARLIQPGCTHPRARLSPRHGVSVGVSVGVRNGDDVVGSRGAVFQRCGPGEETWKGDEVDRPRVGRG